MEFELTEEQQLIRRTARELAAAEFADDPFPDPGEGYPWGYARTLAEHDLLGIRLPQAYGGEGMSALDTVVAMEGGRRGEPHRGLDHPCGEFWAAAGHRLVRRRGAL